MYQSEKINRPLRAGVWYRRPEFLEFLLFGLLFVALTALACFFPMQGDDWAWGSHIGLERLSNSFRNYNGRYLGNLLILALSRSHFLNAVAFALILTLLIYLMQKAGTRLFRSTCLFIPLHFLLRFHPSNYCASVYRQTDWTPLLLCSLCLSGPYFLRILAIWPGSRHALSDRPSARRTGRVRSGCRSALLFQNLLNCMGGFPAAARLYRQPIPAG